MFLLLILTNLLTAQEVRFVDMGVVEGEFKSLEREVAWVNHSNNPVKLKLSSQSKTINLDFKQKTVAPNDTLVIPFTVELAQTPGFYEYEIELGTSELILQKFQLGLQILAPEIDVFEAYRNTHWPFRAKERVFNLRAGYKSDTLQATFDVYNLGGEDLDLKDVKISDSTWVSFTPSTIKHNQFGHMTLYMVASDEATSGFQRTTFDLMINEKLIGKLPVQYTLLPAVQYDSEEQVSGAPNITSSIINHDFKVMKVGEVQSVDITLANLGKAPLKLESIQSNCDCLSYEIPKMNLGSGESIRMTVTFDATNRIGLERKTLAVFSNDPSNPTMVLTFKAHVK
ncbi:DUF1573 domain-containing protein [Roseivirga sp.]|uniref:DUF1573 domain-containing protein n=1 Tax=Roseivirga sp. TaxID=1964215 RepID=UPI003B52C99D